ncbi:hypothetical protein QT987_18935 [Microcoleus sp. SVA1B4]|uniref:hypothetical protein n=1 Tax=Microcoleus sp. B4-C5 TaxID=2818664 RepID=UPI002FD58B48
MPVPQENSLFVERASCLFLRMVQDVSYIRYIRYRIRCRTSFFLNEFKNLWQSPNKNPAGTRNSPYTFASQRSFI